MWSRHTTSPRGWCKWKWRWKTARTKKVPFITVVAEVYSSLDAQQAITRITTFPPPTSHLVTAYISTTNQWVPAPLSFRLMGICLTLKSTVAAIGRSRLYSRSPSSLPAVSRRTQYSRVRMDNAELSTSAKSRHTEEEKAARKEAKKAQKALARAKREGNAPESAGQKPCDLCERGVDLLIRCQVRGGART
eukprot:7260187-Pyramimonas_sp.AAC.1